MKLTNLVNQTLYEAFIKGKAIVYHNFQGVDIDENITGTNKVLNVADCIGNEPHKDYSYFTTEKKKYVEDMVRDASGDGWKNFDPIIALPHPIVNGKYAVIDGNHRLGAFTIGKIPQINVKIISEDKVLLAEQGVEWDENKVPKTIPLVDAKKERVNLREYFATESLKMPSTPTKILTEKDPKKGTGKKPKGSGRRLYTDENPKDTVKVKFSSRQDIVDTLSKSTFKNKSHARQSQVINLIHQRTRAAYGRAKDPAVKKRLKTALDYITSRKEASKRKTKRMNKNELAQLVREVMIEQLLGENYKDGKVKGKSRPGRVKKSGASCKGSVSSLRAKAKKYGGEKGKMYHWCANMKSGRKKK